MSLRAFYRIEAPHFVAGFETDLKPKAGVCVVRAAPIIKWALGKPANELFKYARRKGWKVTNLTSYED